MYYATGRRKESTARVYLKPGKGEIIINEKPLDEYFKMREVYRIKVRKPLEVLGLNNKYRAECYVKGGGTTGQAEAIGLGIARCLANISEEYKKILRKYDLLTRDPREVERKHYNKHKARKAHQWHKR
ncbi:MAG: 30S ribosomal protein S9 [Candidatus Calescibacterium sp.]|nr:30S ribosomal protein S9 [Candidatus Calescibacterium sp.]MDW8132657.1 30S ribosomal protein S9 [Candidatus Calescibacterium sp.]